MTKQRILIGEDDASVLKVTKLRLEHEGYEVISALDGAQDENRGTQAGALDYITKPWAPGELEDRIRIALPDLDSPGPSSPSNEPSRRAIADLDDGPPLRSIVAGDCVYLIIGIEVTAKHKPARP